MNRRYRLERAALYAVVLNIVVRDMDAAVRFYRMLGLDISSTAGEWPPGTGARHADGQPDGGAHLDLDNAEMTRIWAGQALEPGAAVIGFCVPRGGRRQVRATDRGRLSRALSALRRFLRIPLRHRRRSRWPLHRPHEPRRPAAPVYAQPLTSKHQATAILNALSRQRHREKDHHPRLAVNRATCQWAVARVPGRPTRLVMLTTSCTSDDPPAFRCGCRRIISVPADYPEGIKSKGRSPVDMPEGQGRITAFWNTVAPVYETPDNVAPAGTADYANWVEALRSVLPTPPTRVLDVGTGTGFVARIAAELGHWVTAIDLSEGMLDASSARDCGLPITFAVGDAVDPPFPAGSFEVVISRSVLWTLRQPELAFRNWYKLLTPGGRMVAVYGLSAVAGSQPPPDADAEHCGHEPTLFERHYTPETRKELTATYLTGHEPLVTAADAAGFRDVAVLQLEMVRGWETSPGSDLPYALSATR